MADLLAYGLMITLAFNTGVILFGILRDGVTICIEPRRWLVWFELILVVAVIGFGVWQVSLHFSGG